MQVNRPGPALFVLVLIPVLAASTAAAGDDAPWRGSAFTVRNTLSVNSLDRSSELTHNPYYAMSFNFEPRLWFDNVWFLRASLDVTRELTEPDDTTFSGEARVGDLALAAGASRFVRIPFVGVDLSADLVLSAPTSKLSQARTLVLGVGPGVRLSRRFDVLSGLTLAYAARATHFFHRHTTSERESPLVRGCSGSTEGCDPFLNTGVRNPNWRLAHGPDIALSFTEWLALSAAFRFVTDWLYFLENRDPTVSYQQQDAQDQRHGSVFEVSLSAEPMPALQIGLGYNTISPALAPDSSFYNPLYNRYSTIFLDLRLDVAGLVSQISGLLGKGV